MPCLSVDAVRRYKPWPEVYALATEALSVKPADVTFVSFEPLGRHGRSIVRLSCLLDQSRADAGRICRSFAPLHQIPDVATLSRG